MEWTDDGIVLATRPYGEASVVASLLTERHGRHAGLVRGATGPRNRGTLQVGNRVQARWWARLNDHLGALTCELSAAVAGPLLDNPERLAALAAACAVAEASLPEREPAPRVYRGLVILLSDLCNGDRWPTTFVRWEVALLANLGFGLDLSRCAVTGRTDGLSFVSPRTGRAVSVDAAWPYRDRLLTLPAFLIEPGLIGETKDVLRGLQLTEFFLARHVFEPAGKTVPAARQRLAALIARRTAGTSGEAAPVDAPADAGTAPARSAS